LVRRFAYLGLLVGVLAVSAYVAFVARPAAGASSSATLTIAQGTDPQTLDAQASTVSQSLNVSREIEESLTTLNFRTKKFIPLLATSWKQISPTTIEYKLRRGVRFTNGEPFTASVVAFSIKRMQAPSFKSPGALFANLVSRVQIVDKYTVRLSSSPASPLLPLYASRIPMVPPQYVKQKGDGNYSQHPIGTGPYVLSSWVKDDHVTLKANPKYWGGKRQIQTVVFRAIPDASTRMAALRSGEVDVIEELSPDNVGQAKKAGLNVLVVPSLRVVNIQFNYLKGGPLADVRVRRALNYAVDKKSIVKYILGGYGQVLNGQMGSKEYIGYNPALKPYPFDPNKAKQLLAAAGYTSSHPLVMTIYGPEGRYVGDKETVEAIAGYLRKVGVKANAQTMDWGVFLQKVLAKDVAPANYSANAPPPDLGVLYQFNLTCEGSFSQYCSSSMSPLVKKANTIIDPKKRLAFLRNLNTQLRAEAPMLFVNQVDDIYGARSNVHGFRPNPDENFLLSGVTVS
jgi:peptide/nickel transport system substrate-binding protein